MRTAEGDGYASSSAQILGQVRRAVGKETHVLAVRPDLTWQQLHNRLQWAEPPLRDHVAAERERRSGPGNPPWLHRYSPPRESEALLGTLAGENTMISGARVSPDGSWVASASRIIRPGKAAGWPETEYILKLWDVKTRTVRAILPSRELPAVSPDGTWMASDGRDGAVKIWDTATGKGRATLTGHKAKVAAVAISPAADWIVTASLDRTLKIWDLATGTTRATLRGHSQSVSDCEISPDGEWIVSAGADGSLRVWDATSGRPRATIDTGLMDVRTCTISPDGAWIMGSGREEVGIWDRTTGAVRHTFPGHSGAVSPGGTWIVTVSGSTLDIWDTDTGRMRATLSGHTELVFDCAVSPDGAWIVSTGRDRTLRVWDVATGTERTTLTGHSDQVIGCVISADGSRIVSASRDDTLRIWDAAEGTRSLATGQEEVKTCQISPDGRWAASAGLGNTVELWDAATGDHRSTLAEHDDRVTQLAVSPNSEWLVSASLDNTLRIWDTDTGNVRATLMGHTSNVAQCAVDPNGSWVLSASLDNTIRIWDAATGKERAVLSGHPRSPEGCAISRDGRWVVIACGDHHLTAWEIDSGRVLLSTAGHKQVDGESIFDGWPGGVLGCEIGADGTWLVTALKGSDTGGDVGVPYLAHPGTLQLWNAATARETVLLKGHRDLLRSFALSPDGVTLASAAEDNTVRVWEAGRGTERMCLETHTDSVTSVAFSPDGSLIASGGEDNSLRISAASSGTELATLFLPGPVHNVHWNPADSTLVFATPLGGLEFARLVGVEMGPPIVTPFATDDGYKVVCRHCRHQIPWQTEFRGETISCPQSECTGTMRVTEFEQTAALPGTAIPKDDADAPTAATGGKRRWFKRERPER